MNECEPLNPGMRTSLASILANISRSTENQAKLMEGGRGLHSSTSFITTAAVLL